MAKNTKNIPELRFPESREWFCKKLGELLTFKNGLNSDKEKYGKGIKFINVLDIINNDFMTYDNVIGKVEVTDKEFEKNRVDYGDILFQRSSETREEVGQANIYLDKSKSAVFGGFVIRGKRIAEYEPVFMKALLETSAARKDITSKSGGSTRYNVGQETLKGVELYLPSLPEQEKIAAFLSAVDKKIQQLTRKKELLEQYKKGVMQKIFSQEIRFKNENGNGYPDWEEKRLGDVGEIIGGGTPDTSEEDFWNGGIPWLTPSEIKTKYISGSRRTISQIGLQKSSAKTLPKGALIFTSRATIGELSISLEPCTTNQGFQSIIVSDDFDNEFAYYLIKFYRKVFLRRSQGSTFLEINKTEMKKIKLHFPLLSEQKVISSFLSCVDKKINVIQNQFNQMQAFKKGLLQQMFV